MLLGSSKAEVDSALARPVMAPSVLGMTPRGEKAYSYSHGADTIIVGFFDNMPYLAVKRNHGPKGAFSPAEMASILALNAPSSQWKKEAANQPSSPKTAKSAAAIAPAPSNYYSFIDPKLKLEIVGWEPGGRPFAFFLLPTWPGQQPILLNEAHVANALS